MTDLNNGVSGRHRPAAMPSLGFGTAVCVASETFRYPRKSTIAPTAIVIHMKVSPAIFPTSSVFPFPVTTKGIIRERRRDSL